MNRNGSNNGHNNGHDAALDATHELLWDGLSPAVTDALGQPLDPALVSQRKGRAGRTYDYLEGHVVIDQANRIFGFGGWGYELAGDATLREIENVDTKTGEVKRIQFYSAPVRVTVAGALPRTDIGFNAVAEDNADGHETAIKGAVTDGMKRALRSFGVQFGNGFYGDQPEEEPKAQQTAARQTARNGGASRSPARSRTGQDAAQAAHRDRRRAGSRRGQGAERRHGPDGQGPRRPDGRGAGSAGGGRSQQAPGGERGAAGEGGLAGRSIAGFGVERGRLHRGRPRSPFTGQLRDREVTSHDNHDNDDAHALGASPGHRGAGRGRLAGVHRRPRRTEAQPRSGGTRCPAASGTQC